MIVAIDPGASGGIAAGDGDEIQTFPMPEDVPSLRKLLKGLKPERVVIEKVGGFIAGSPAPGSAMFNFGYNAGTIEGIVCAMGVRYEFVTPQTWQKPLGLGGRKSCNSPAEWKRKLKTCAKQRFHSIDVTLGNADALLILDWAMR